MFFCDIETDRLLLKNISRDDRDFILLQFSDNSVNEFLFDAEPLCSIEESDELITFYTVPEPRDRHRWIITLKESDRKIGTCGFHCWNSAAKCVDVGYDLQREFWGRGIMGEAMAAMLATYVPKLGVDRVFARIARGNHRSAKLAQKLGFALSGETEILPFHGKDYLHDVYVRGKIGEA